MTVREFRAGSGAIATTIEVPGDKSLSHRALFLAAMAEGTSLVRGLAPGADVAATATCLARLGPRIVADRVVSRGVAAWTPPDGPLDAANSGTTMRLLAGALSPRPFAATIIGDASLSRRPMGRLRAPLEALGARIDVSQQGTAPVTVHGRPLRGADISIPLASAQVRTAVALASLQATGRTTIDSPPGFRDHTERWLAALGRGAWIDATRFGVDPGDVEPLDITIPGDPSSAAYLWAAASLAGGTVSTPGVSLNPGRTGFLDVLVAMGVSVDVTPERPVLGDPVGTVRVGGRPTRAVRVEGPLIARSLDELPLVGLLAATIPGTSVIADASELRAKESDRIDTTVAMLTALGADALATDDGFVVRGGPLHPATVLGHGDHRIALTGAVAAAATGSVLVDGYDAVAVSWPDFAETWERLWS